MLLRVRLAGFRDVDFRCDVADELRLCEVDRERWLADDFALRLRCVRRPAFKSRSAFFRVEALPFFGGPTFTPARRALDKPIAMACLGFPRLCLPSFSWCISSRTNSAACVVGAFPCRLSLLARSVVRFSGMRFSPERWTANSAERFLTVSDQ